MLADNCNFIFEVNGSADKSESHIWACNLHIRNICFCLQTNRLGAAEGGPLGFPSFGAEVNNCATKSESKYMGSNILNLLQVLKYIARSSLVPFATQRDLN